MSLFEGNTEQKTNDQVDIVAKCERYADAERRLRAGAIEELPVDVRALFVRKARVETLAAKLVELEAERVGELLPASMDEARERVEEARKQLAEVVEKLQEKFGGQ